MLQMFVLALSLYNTWNRGVFLLCKITNLLIYSMEKARNDELYRALKEKDYPDDFCREIAYNQIRTDYTATRMLGYLYRTSNPRAEDVVDEMLAIFSDRDAVMQKKELEHAQATINQIYRDGL